MARVYTRRKEPGKGWRYKAVPKGAGRRPTLEPGAKFHVRYPDASGKFVWSRAYDTFEEAQREAAGLELNAKAVAMGLTLEEFKDRQNANRVPLKPQTPPDSDRTKFHRPRLPYFQVICPNI
jgi:hypothetical protein